MAIQSEIWHPSLVIEITNAEKNIMLNNLIKEQYAKNLKIVSLFAKLGDFKPRIKE